MEPVFNFIGWCNENDHDKIWVNFSINGVYYCAWGRRGRKLSFKKHNKYSVESVQRTKESRYKEVDEFLLFSIFPDFSDQVQQDLMMATLSGTVK